MDDDVVVVAQCVCKSLLFCIVLFPQFGPLLWVHWKTEQLTIMHQAGMQYKPCHASRKIDIFDYPSSYLPASLLIISWRLRIKDMEHIILSRRVWATDSASDWRPASSKSASSTPSSNSLLLIAERRALFTSRFFSSCFAWVKKLTLPTKTERDWLDTVLNCCRASASRISCESLKYSALSLSLAPAVDVSSSIKWRKESVN